MAEKYSVKDGLEIGQVPRRTSTVYLGNENYTVQLSDRAIRQSVSSTATWTITLPPVSKAAGLTLTISVTIADTAQVAVQDRDDSDNWTDLDMDADNDRVVLYSDGVEWWIIFNGIA